MSLFDDGGHEPPAVLSPDHVAYLRRVIETHSNDLSSGGCPICGVRCCADWRNAYDSLAADGHLMAGRDRWRLCDQEGSD
jgi:hypothetical protein